MACDTAALPGFAAIRAPADVSANDRGGERNRTSSGASQFLRPRWCLEGRPPGAIDSPRQISGGNRFDAEHHDQRHRLVHDCTPKGNHHFDSGRVDVDGTLVLHDTYGAGDKVATSMAPNDQAIVVSLNLDTPLALTRPSHCRARHASTRSVGSVTGGSSRLTAPSWLAPETCAPILQPFVTCR